jgi:hypothetical protein
MLNCVTTTAEEVTGTTGLPRAFSNTLGNAQQVNISSGVAGAGRGFFVSAGAIMADQTVYFGLIGKIKILIFPAVANMAAGTARLVRGNGNTEIVKSIDFSALNLLTVNLLLEAPGPVTGFHNLPGSIIMAL